MVGNYLGNCRSKLKNSVSIGSWLTLPSLAGVEIMARAGFDWLTVDCEHTTLSVADLGDMLRTIALCGPCPLVRVSENNQTEIKRALDAGAQGIIVPMVNSAEEAEKAVASVRYPPRGRRGVGLGRAQGYGTVPIDVYQEWLEKESLLMVQIEHFKAVENIKEIIDVPGIDGFFVGPYDLSASLGIAGKFDHPKMLEAMGVISQHVGKFMAGFHTVHPDPGIVRTRRDEGYRFLGYSTDFFLLGEAARSGIAAIKR